MTPADIAAIEARLLAATPGPWTLGVRGGEQSHHAIWARDRLAIIPETDDHPGDANLIAHAPTDIADLLAEVRRLTARVAEVEAEREDVALERDGAYEDVARLMCEHAAEIAAGQRQIDHVDRERDALLARVAEMEEDRRWRPASERPTQHEDVEIAMRGARDIGYYFGEGVWSLGEGYDAIDADILGWRPLGPGPVAP